MRRALLIAIEQGCRFSLCFGVLMSAYLSWRVRGEQPTVVGFQLLGVFASIVAMTVLHTIAILVLLLSASVQRTRGGTTGRGEWLLGTLGHATSGWLAAGVAAGVMATILTSPMWQWVQVLVWRTRERGVTLPFGVPHRNRSDALAWSPVFVLVIVAVAAGVWTSLGPHRRARLRRGGQVLAGLFVVAVLPLLLFRQLGAAPGYEVDHQSALIVDDGAVVGAAWASLTELQAGAPPRVTVYAGTVDSVALARHPQLRAWVRDTSAVAIVGPPQRCGGPPSVRLTSRARADADSRLRTDLTLPEVARAVPMYLRAHDAAPALAVKAPTC